jgi:hypothetical protein
MKKIVFDLSDASLKEFEEFVFEHEVHHVGSDQVWYHEAGLTIRYDADHNARSFAEMFRDARSWPSKFDRFKLEQGCWAMFGAGFEDNLNDLIWKSEASLSSKVTLISSMFFVYRDLFSSDPLEGACEMWWDGLAYVIHPMRIVDPANDASHRRIQEAMFQTLAKILTLDVRHCQIAALHGLNHVAHPETKDLIMSFIAHHQELSAEEIEYAIACANGEAL